MTTYVLVHGAWHGGWCWKKTAPLLRRAGAEVFTPTLTGMGERAHLNDRLDPTRPRSRWTYISKTSSN